MLTYPNISPTIVRIAGLEIRWYGVLYIISFIIGYIFLRKTLPVRNVNLQKEQYENLLFNLMLGVIIGGRIGFVLFYNLGFYFSHPLHIFAVWQGGMSFHGGAIGAIAAGYLFAGKHKYTFYQIADPAMQFVAIGLGLGRLGNFINAELYGRITNVPWAMIFPTDPEKLPRHPSQIYEFFLEGIALFFISFFLLKKTQIQGLVFWFFIGFYGIFRFLIEFFRQPDEQIGFILNIFTMGQVLSSFMIISSVIAIVILFNKNET
jgi:phosphatidylglycerol:prolipoprotein diacylglycerol transferase